MTDAKSTKHNLCATSARFLVCILVGVLSAVGVAAQTRTTSSTDGATPLALTPGAPAGSYALSDLDNINLYNGSLNFRLPLARVWGRGTAAMTVALADFERHWRVERSEDPDAGLLSFVPDPTWWTAVKPGYGPGILEGRNGGFSPEPCPAFSSNLVYGLTLTRLTFTAADGTEYELRDQLTNGQPATVINYREPCPEQGRNRGRVFITADGSAATFISNSDIYDDVFFRGVGNQFRPSGDLYLRDGTRYHIESGLVMWVRDRNGNRLSFTYVDSQVTRITDSLNRTVTIEYWYDLNTNYDRITYKGFGGNQRTVLVWYSLLTGAFRSGQSLRTYKQLFPTLDGTETDYNPRVISKVQLPDGREYRFLYNSYSELARVELPTGGAIEYDFGPGATADPQGVVVAGPQYGIYRRVVERRVYPDGVTLEQKTRFSDTTSSNPDSTTVTVDHLGAGASPIMREKHYFLGKPSESFNKEATDYPGWQDGRENKTDSFDVDGGTVLRRATNTWEQRTGVSWWSGDSSVAPPNDPRLVESVTTLMDTAPNKVTKRSAINPQTGAVGFDQYNNQTDVWEYDFGSAAAGPLIRHTHIDYLTTNNGSNYATDTNIHIRNLPAQQSVYDAGDVERSRTTYEYDNYNQTTSDVFHAALTNRLSITGLDASSTTTYYTRGNVTKSTSAVSFDSNGNVTNSISAHAQYDIAGNVIKAIDPRSISDNIIATTFDLSDRFGVPDDEARGNTQAPTELGALHTYAFPTLATNALSHTVYTQYDYYLGKPVNSEDANGIVAKVRYDDTLDRPTGVDVGIFTGSVVQRHTSFVYTDSSHLIATKSDQTTLNDGLLTSTLVYDGLGRTTETRTSAPEGTIYTRQEYDALGRVKRTYNPYRTTSDETYGYTDAAYDALGRVSTVTTSDNAVVTTTYLGNAMTVIDQAGKKRRSITDGLGRLIRVDESDSSGNLDNTATPPQPLQPTSYVYDVLDDLTTVTQGTQPSRSFVYDSLKRLTDATNPESGHVQYTYDNNGNLQTKTDARPITTTYAYDALNRVTSRTYSDNTPAVSYKYDSQSLPAGFPAAFTRGSSIGRLVAVTYGGTSAGTYTGYDQLGRVISSYQQTDSQNYGFGYGYNLAAEMTREKYPSGNEIRTTYDAAGRVSDVKRYINDVLDKTYASQFSYAAHRAVSAMQLGNSKWEHTNFNNRLQPTEIGLGASSGASDLLKLEYTYGTTANNGNVLTQKITAPKSDGSGNLVLIQNYSYDALNRLNVAEELISTTSQWKQTYDIDRWGNRAVRSSSYIPPQNINLTPQSANSTDFSAFNQNTNRIALGGFGYDNSGNLTGDPVAGANAMVYDAENRQTSYTKSGATTTYSYDGDGHRVKRTDPDNTTTIFVYNVAGQLIAEYTSGTPSPNGTSYLTSDHLGSTRVVTNSSGGVKARYDYLPFGEEIPSTVGARSSVTGYGGADSIRQKFTQKERDNESGLDYFLARYYSSAQGRFTSVDPLVLSLTKASPQSWNKYTYTLNNPLALVDPDGWDWYRKDGTNYWFDGSDEREGYERLKIGKEGLRITNVQGATGQYSQYNGHNITLYNDASRLVDNGVYVPPATYVPDLPDKSGEVGKVLLEFEALSIAGGIGAAFSGASLLGYSVATAGLDFLVGLSPPPPDLSTLPVAATVEGPFSVSDWSGYPEGAKPEGPFRILEGQELKDAQAESRRVLDALHRADPSLAGKDLHHVHPIQFGGPPNGEVVPLSRAGHAPFTSWWARLARALKK